MKIKAKNGDILDLAFLRKICEEHKRPEDEFVLILLDALEGSLGVTFQSTDSAFSSEVEFGYKMTMKAARKAAGVVEE
jgi:hypothetical protein